MKLPSICKPKCVTDVFPGGQSPEDGHISRLCHRCTPGRAVAQLDPGGEVFLEVCHSAHSCTVQQHQPRTLLLIGVELLVQEQSSVATEHTFRALADWQWFWVLSTCIVPGHCEGSDLDVVPVHIA
eukprot:6488498-Amphidinium_carterae.3